MVRDAYLESQGWKVLRFWNNEVFHNREGVLETIHAHTNKPSSGAARHLLPEGEGERRWPFPVGGRCAPKRDG